MSQKSVRSRRSRMVRSSYLRWGACHIAAVSATIGGNAAIVHR